MCCKKSKLFLPAALLFCAAAALSAAPGEIVGKRFAYQGFYIEPLPGSRWKLIGKYDRNTDRRTRWAIVEPANILHTRLATVVLSTPLQVMVRKGLTLETMKERIEAHYSRQIGHCVEKLQVSSKYTVIHGVKFVDIFSSALDVGSKYRAAAPKMRLYGRMCCTITADGRVLTIMVSERIPDEKAAPDRKAMEDFIQSVHLGDPAK